MGKQSDSNVECTLGHVEPTMGGVMTATSPFAMRSANTEFIRAWKVAGLLVIPKYMTFGSYSPLLVTIAPSDVELSEILHLRQPIDDISRQWKWVPIFDSNLIQFLVVLDWS